MTKYFFTCIRRGFFDIKCFVGFFVFFYLSFSFSFCPISIFYLKIKTHFRATAVLFLILQLELNVVELAYQSLAHTISVGNKHSEVFGEIDFKLTCDIRKKGRLLLYLQKSFSFK